MKLAMKRVELIIDYEQNTMSRLFIMKLIVPRVYAEMIGRKNSAHTVEDRQNRGNDSR